ncbi:intraflagellar transport protein 43 homolog [Ceratitis capitata]|uniref:(Mediterranean fruit fly) hypothetical protein n=1 Tax=Ceratitis capitata TaxID=7213 RepID=W8C143_CERCA|nr:intraflagellar transport protein 43 homolog [Ceratitis capitata]CAD6999734.1 unnamed protein product [Ceratitis capitata]
MMDWAEELKLSIRKKTARKGRRSKSRDPIGGASTSINVSNQNKNEKEISIDITLDLQQNSSTAASEETDASKKPPPRRISGGWADVGLLKSSKTKKGASFDDERFQSVSLAKSPIGSPSGDEIPTIPDMDDLKDEILLNEILEPPVSKPQRLNTLSELNLDLLNQNAFASMENVDLTVLTRCLKLPETLDEPDEVWEWDKLFTDVISDIHSDQQSFAGGQKKEIGPDEIPPPMYA